MFWDQFLGQARRFDSVLFCLWMFVTFKIVALKCHRGWVSVRIRDGTCGWIAWLDWTVPLTDARQTKVISALAWPLGYLGACWAVSLSRCLQKLHTVIWKWRSTVPNNSRCHSHPCTSPTLTLQPTDTSSNWHLVWPLITHSQTSLALKGKCIGTSALEMP